MAIDREATLKNAEKFLRVGRLDAAIAEYARVLEDHPGDSNTAELRLATLALSQSRFDEAKTRLAELAVRSDESRHSVLSMAWHLAESRPDASACCVEVLVDLALARGDFKGAATLLQQYAALIPHHVPTVLRLVEVCVDGELDDLVFSSQALLADAYLASGDHAAARVIAEDLLDRDPGNASYADRLRRTLDELTDVRNSSGPKTPASGVSAVNAQSTVEIDLTGLLGGLDAQPSPRPTRDLDQVFAELRADAEIDEDESASSEHLELARTYIQLGQIQEAVGSLRTAARSPRYRFSAASMLGEIHRDEGDLRAAIEWFERAAEVPVPDAERSRALLYDLADLLETVGETARSLAVFLELQAEAPEYRDIRDRVARLSRIETEG